MDSALYLVPTPIGNLEDISRRALSVLEGVDLIAAESRDRVSVLLGRYAIRNKICALRRSGERLQSRLLLGKLQAGHSVALVCDAGTPLISDPGAYLVELCHSARIRVVPLPGPCAAVVALSASGLPTDRFCCDGFLPSRRGDRLRYLRTMARERRTMVLYEVKHRLVESLTDMAVLWEPSRRVTLAQELSKVWERCHRSTAAGLVSWLKEDGSRLRGEAVLVVEGCRELSQPLPDLSLATRILTSLMRELPLRSAVLLSSEIFGIGKNFLYRKALDLSREVDREPGSTVAAGGKLQAEESPDSEGRMPGNTWAGESDLG